MEERLDNSYRGYIVCGRGPVEGMLQEYLLLLERNAPRIQEFVDAAIAVRGVIHRQDTEGALQLVNLKLPALMQRHAPVGTVYVETQDGMKFVEWSYDLQVTMTAEQYEYLKFGLETSLIGAARMPRKRQALELLQVLFENAWEVAYGAVHKEA